ncbi:DsbA family oxidoreductase [Flavobacterium sp. SE-1-e]|uniref:DsbA family oxidoreductase n=1 Tax=Flavobacterium agrisoli TaxID=2793066 RepID=A0A934PKY6_9FLAO|nr:DsbA family oxidoreductase [Flavobacterium agrisoli]
MTIEIWSDILCPFCYIGKRHLEAALKEFPNQSFIIKWKSFQLNPNLKPDSTQNSYTSLAQQKGISVAESKAMHQNVVERAAQVGLTYDFEKTVVTNSLNMHRLLHLAATENVATELKELFFKSYFTDGKNLNDPEILKKFAVQAGIEESKVIAVLENPEMYANEVQKDMKEAQEIGIQGVPFFVFDRKYAISGAQPVTNFVKTIESLSTDSN